MLWKIHGSETFILGSVHLGDFDVVDTSKVIKAAFDRSETIVFEADLERAAAVAPAFLDLPDGQRLGDLVPAPVYEITAQHWARLGLHGEDLIRRKPSVAAAVLNFTQANRMGFVEQHGVDRPLWELALQLGKKREYLETPEYQFRRIFDGPMHEQVSILEDFAKKDDAGLAELVSLIVAWKNDDLNFLDEYVRERLERWPATFNSLICQRNRDWAPKIASMARRGKPTLVVIGALHLVGDQGVPSLLTNAGFALEKSEWPT
ncbi:TraB/GumN family protein [Paraburkholderia sp. Tr-20389]|uniref:TraB/GumN family protein n=1 Tax=Paraburkholderia sp. Tr-20389 TaxID=2703903 RepID=UPI00197D1367|nr:TraB/GumN family protein [Paraburkholderia sp. Tr-20389]MBN3754276.1 TraB/GumN family protein [Paraburkholderia sp. Tr-20389]